MDGSDGDTYLQKVDARILESDLTATGAVVGVQGVPGRQVEIDVTMENGRIEDLLTLAVKAGEPVLRGAVQLRAKLVIPPEKKKVIDRLRLRGDRVHANWLQGMGADLGALDEEQRRFLIRAMRHDARLAEEYFTGLLHRQVAPLRAPVISVVGERDPGTEFYQERYREWGFLSDTTALVVLEEGVWKVAQYNLSIPIPNDLAAEIVRLIQAR